MPIKPVLLGDESNLQNGRFKWVENPEELKGNISKLDKKAGKGYLLEVNVSYPNILHNLHNDLQFMCKRRNINGVQKLFPICMTRRNMSFTLWLSITCSNMGWSCIRSIERLV